MTTKEMYESHKTGLVSGKVGEEEPVELAVEFDRRDRNRGATSDENGGKVAGSGGERLLVH